MFKFISKIIFTQDINSMFIIAEPLRLIKKLTFSNLVKNSIFNLLNLRFKKFIKNIILLIFIIIINVIKIFYIPLIIIIYFSKYRFVQINYSQVGALNYHLNVMVKINLIRGYKSIILIPRYCEFAFIKKIFKNLIIIDNLFLNIILLPLKHTSLISCKNEEVEPFVDSGGNLIPKIHVAKIYSEYNKIKNNSNNLFCFNETFKKEMKSFFETNYPNLNINKLFIIHSRDDGYSFNSSLRSSNAETYLSSIKYLVKLGFGVIRLVHSKSKKLYFANDKYLELNTDYNFNKQLQYYLISICKGFMVNSSGPATIGPLFNVPIYETNLWGINAVANKKKDVFILKKIRQKNKLLTYKKLVDLGFFNGMFLSSSSINQYRLKVINNSAVEILGGLKEFIFLQKKITKLSRQQILFKKILPNYIEYKHYSSNISKYFLKKNKKLFGL